MTDGWRRARIVGLSPLTPTVRSVRLQVDPSTTFIAGQHVDVRLTADDGYVAQRSYSIASPPSERGMIELVIERLRDGEVSPYFHEEAAIGDEIEVRGPFAEHFVWRSGQEGPVLLVAGGSGVAPFLSMVRQHAHEAAPPHMSLLYSARTWDDVIAGDELVRRGDSQPGMQLTLCLTRASAVPPGVFARRIDAAIVAEVLDKLPEAPRQAFVCGANQFVGDVADLLVGAGVAPSIIRTERYGGA